MMYVISIKTNNHTGRVSRWIRLAEAHTKMDFIQAAKAHFDVDEPAAEGFTYEYKLMGDGFYLEGFSGHVIDGALYFY